MHVQSRAVDVIYLGTQKAIDIVPHRRLMINVEEHGIPGKVLKWLDDWPSELNM